jgi:ATP-dependent Clp protease ATP-binding subunit ClpB
MDYGLQVSDAALAEIANAGFDPVYGARPLKRAIQQQLENPLAQRILGGEFGSGDTILVRTDGGHLVFDRSAAPMGAPPRADAGGATAGSTSLH